jgi:hypothetical protein
MSSQSASVLSEISEKTLLWYKHLLAKKSRVFVKNPDFVASERGGDSVFSLGRPAGARAWPRVRDGPMTGGISVSC